MNNDFTRWFAAQPFSTKWIGVISIIIPVLMKLMLLSPHWVVFYSPLIFKKFQIWRIFSSLFVTTVNLSFVFSLYFRCQYSAYLETIQFAGRPADYLWFLLLSTTVLAACNTWLGASSLWQAFSMTIIYVWAQYNKAVTVSFMFGFRFPALYLPLVMALYDLVTNGDFYGTLLGIFTGHVYYFSKEILSRSYPGVLKWLEAPRFLKTVVSKCGGRVALGPGQSQTNSAGFTMYAPERPLKKGDESDNTKSSFKAFSGTAKKLGS